jgi:hypothetical protein
MTDHLTKEQHNHPRTTAADGSSIDTARAQAEQRSVTQRCVRCANGEALTPDGFHALGAGAFKRCTDLPPYEPPVSESPPNRSDATICQLSSNQYTESLARLEAHANSIGLDGEIHADIRAIADEIERLRAALDKALEAADVLRPPAQQYNRLRVALEGIHAMRCLNFEIAGCQCPCCRARDALAGSPVETGDRNG